MHRPTIIGTCLALLLAGLARAQDLPPTSAAAAPEKTVSRDVSEIEEVRPPLYYLEDAQGELRPAFGFTLEEFLLAYNQLHHLEQESPHAGYVIRKLAVDGQTEDHLARLTISFEVAFQENGTFRIPLALGQVVIDGDPEYTGKGTPLIFHEEDSGGYAVRFEGEANSSHRLTLKVLAPLTSVGDQAALRLAVPSATMSELRLIVPVAGAAATASDGTLVKTSPVENGEKTELNVQGFRGDFELSWRKPEACPAASPAVLESSGEILAVIDSRGIEWKAALRVRGHGGTFDRVQVRLPAEAELLPSSAAEHRVVSASEADASDVGGRIVEVRLREKTVGPVTLHLAARRTLDESMFGKWVEMAGFSVVGAARQWGHLAVQVADDLEALFDPQWGVRQTDELPETLSNEDIVAGFEYATVPGSLLARIAPSRTRVSVEPQYVLVVGAEQIQLTTVLRYSVRGKKVRVLDVDLAGWEYDEIGPDNLVAIDKVMEDDSGMLSIPLLRPSSSRMEVTLRARRRVKAEDETLELTFPRPLGAASSPAAIVIVPEDNVQLTVEADATRGLLRQQASPPMTVPRHQQTPMFFRGDPATAVFVARHEIHAREIAVRSTTLVNLDAEAGQVKQRFAYKIDYEPRDVLMLRVSRELAESDQLEFRVDGQIVSRANLTRIPTAESPDGNGSVQIQVALGSPRIGMCNLDVRYPLAPHRLAPRSSLRRVVPLVVPLDGVLLGNRLIATSPPELKLAMAEGPWKKQGG
ncbi:MAG TPA: hypothetical protein DD670_07325, partial [Planctomycetaceae bacterium]|nr:hypothetical protein [Planctomycetaceae bacterium]